MALSEVARQAGRSGASNRANPLGDSLGLARFGPPLASVAWRFSQGVGYCPFRKNRLAAILGLARRGPGWQNGQVAA